MKRSHVVLILSLLAVAGAWLFWSPARQLAPVATSGNSAATAKTSANPGAGGDAATNVAKTFPTLNTNRLAFRLSNTSKSLRQLENTPHAVLLANAFIDTDAKLDLKIPTSLQAKGDPGAYIVQARGPVNGYFRSVLAAAGAQIVSYMPNNAYLVRVTPAAAGVLAGNSLVQAVLPYQPYYKLQSSLLGLAVNAQPLPPGTALTLGLFAADATATEAQLAALGAKIIGRDQSPFGPVLRVLAPANWTALAQVPGVQIMEPMHRRVAANDLSRVTAGISPDTLSGITNNYLGLTGSNVLVQVNDTGVDTNQPDLLGRVMGYQYIDMVDTNGHGTHVAGIIASSGAHSTIASSGAHSTTPTDVGEFAEGSISNADFRGKAPFASLFSLNLNNYSDYALQTNAAMVNALISNNSWDNGDPNYDLASASYDWATRDALPYTTGSQPVLFVFAAGNSGGGDNVGQEGNGDSILSPGTAKNVITVGALEQPRYITNIVTTIVKGQTNKTEYWHPWTDSGNQVAWYSSRGNVGIGTEGAFGRFKPDVISPGTFVVSTRSGQWDTNSYYNPTNYQTKTYPDQIVNTNELLYYNVAVPPNAVGVIINITANQYSPNPFPNLLLYARQTSFPTPTNYDILKTNNNLSIPPDNGGAITGLSDILGNGFAFAVGNSTNLSVNYNVTVQILTTNYVGDLNQVLEGMNETLAPDYRYETGTSMAAADVSGVLALVQDYFTNTLALTPSPALMKALLINGSRTVGAYGLAITNGINFQGWGEDNIQDIVPAGGLINKGDGVAAGSSFFVDQSPTNALATGDSHTYIVTINPDTAAEYYFQLQATLVWTDPPGDPAAAIKLVNNLDLIITNLDTGSSYYGSVYFGNDISQSGYNQPWDTNSVPNLDSINNVENIILPAPLLAGTYSVTVVGRSVNVNAVMAQTNNAARVFAPNIVQDYALVISLGEGEVTNAFTVKDGGIASNPTGDQNITIVTTTNTPLFNQMVGASSPLLGTNNLPLGTNTVWGSTGILTVGMTNQWHFYIVTNNGPGADFTNAAFITFDPYTLSIPRMGVFADSVANSTRPEADIDLYVSQDSSITNLNPVAISNCLAGVNNSRSSVGQGGTEFVFYTNSVSVAAGGNPSVYYVGVKSEDQMASEYAFMPVFTDIPFSQLDQNGNQIVHGLLLPVNIPTGNNTHPGVANVFALAVMPMTVQKVTVTNLDEHQNFGDLVGALNFAQTAVVLNNHDGFTNTINHAPIVYDDSRNRPAGTTNSDGPGSLVNYRAKSALGPWILNVLDDSAGGFTGQVSQLTLVIQPHRPLDQGGAIVSVPPLSWFIDYVDVGANYTNLIFYATNLPPTIQPLPLQLYEKLGNDPTFTDFDQMDLLTNCLPGTGTYPNGTDPGNTISVGPPLPQGRYFVGIYNPSATQTASVYVGAVLGINTSASDVYNFTSGSGQLLPDDAVTGSVIAVPNTVTQLVASVNVGLVVNSPRISDYTFTLVSPTGQRVLLMENRGGGDTNGAGQTFIYTNVLNTTASGGGAAQTNYLTVDPAGGFVPIVYDFFTVPDRMTVYDTTNANLFQTNGAYNILDTGFINNPNGPATTNAYYPSLVPPNNVLTIIMNQDGNPFSSSGDAWTFTAGAPITNYEYLVFTDNTNLANVPIKFAPPPYNFANTSTNFLFGNFNVSTNGDYLAPTNIYDAFGGWTLPTNLVTYATTASSNGVFVTITNVVNLTNNLVSVIADPYSALTGDAGNSNLLALAKGTITRSIPTTPGHIYNVTFWYRGPGISGWWRGEGNASDSSDPENNNNNGTLIGRFNFPAGEVGQAFEFQDPGNTYQFAATNTYVQVPASTSLNVGAGGGFTIEGWINPTNLTRPQPLFEWLAHVPTNSAVTNVIIVQGPVLNPATGHYYYLLGTTNWTTSELWAKQLGGHLATVETANEENWIYDTFTAYGTLNRDLWIGYTNTGPNTAFGWSSGITNVTYTNWVTGVTANQTAGYQYTAVLGPTNALPGLWVLMDNLRRIAGNPTTNPVYGVVEVPSIPTNGVQFWISGTNWTPGITNVLAGCLYANIVDTNYVSHQIFSAPGLLQSNVYQYVALTYNTNTGVAALYLNGTNVATTNLSLTGVPVVPKTDGDLLIGWDMSLYTNNFYGGEMDEISLYSRALSDAEITAIYQASVLTTNRLAGKFDPSVTPAIGLAEALVNFGGTSNVIFGVNNKWSVNSYTFLATTNSMPLTISGIEPGILLDTFSVSDAPETNLYYLPEQALAAVDGLAAGGNWTLQVWDNRIGAYVTNVNELVNWQLSVVLVSNAVITATLPPETPVATTVPAGQTVYYSVTVPAWAHFATNLLVSSSVPVQLLFFNTNNYPPGTGPDATLLTGSTGGAGSPALHTAPVGTELQLQPGGTYYLGVQNSNAVSATVVLEVDYDIVNLTNGVPFANVLNTNEYNSVRYFEYDVSSNAYETTFQLLHLSGNADLVIQKGVPLPTLISSAYGSFNVSTNDENIFVLTNSTPVPLSAGRWFLGVFKRDSGLITNTVLVKEQDTTNPPPTIISLTNAVPFKWTAGPGAALTNFFHFSGTNNPTLTNAAGIRFELYNLSGNGDLTVQTSTPPLAPPFFQSSQNPGTAPELIFVFTNNVLTNLATDWYLGVPNHDPTNISFTIIAEILTNSYFPAFPGAAGAGGGAVGGGHAGQTNGTVYHVTTTADSGPGSLRAAVGATNRTVVFDISGAITLASPLVITNSYLTIAGQTAPGGGITVLGNVTTLTNAHDVILRDLRFRPSMLVTNSGVAWTNGFEGGSVATINAGSHFAGGWAVDFGSIDVVNTTDFIPSAYTGTYCLDLDGFHAIGGISTNIAKTVAGQSYHLNFEYSKNPDAPTPPIMQILVNGNTLATMVVNITNSYANINWQPTSFVFTATSPTTLLAFHSLDPAGDSYGVYLDAMSLISNSVTSTSPGDSVQFLNASNVIADHISAEWSAANDLSTLNASNLTVQWSILSDSLYFTNNPQGTGSMLRGGNGTLSFHHNLYADNYRGSPRLGDNLTLDFVNNVIYNWGPFSGLSGGTNDLSYSTNGCTNQLNYVCNYLIAGPDTAGFGTNYAITNIAFFGGMTNALAATWIFQTNNFIDSNTNGVLNGSDTGWAMFTNQLTPVGWPFPLPPVSTDEAFLAYERVLDFAGPDMCQRDAVDTNIVTNVRYQTGRLINLPGASPVPATTPQYLDTDQDGIPDFWEDTFTTNLVFLPSNNHDRNGDGYTDLEEYDNWLAAPHALTVTNAAVGVDLYQLCGQSGHLAFYVTNGVNGSVALTNVLNYTNVIGTLIAVTNTSAWSNSYAVFTPTNTSPAFSGYASFDVYVTNLDTEAYFGPVTVSVIVSPVPVLTTPAVNIIQLINNIPYPDPNTGGSDFYSFDVEPLSGTNALAVLFSVTNATAPVTLVVNYGLPLPSLSAYEYIATNWAAGENILVTSNSLPVPLTNGLWYLGVVNVSGGTVDYNVKATAYYTIVPPLFFFPTNTTVTNIIETVPFAMSCVATDLDIPPLPLTYKLVSGPTNMVVTNGVIGWTPLETQGPTTNGWATNIISVSVGNGVYSITNTFTIIVVGTNLPPVFVLTNIPNQVVIPPGALNLTNAATNPNLPNYPLTYTLLNAPANAAIDVNGDITWLPALAQAGTNYLFTTVVTDTNPWAINAKSLSATNSFYVYVPTPLPGGEPGLPLTNVVAPGGVNWFAVAVPTNAIDATNILWFASLPVNLLFSTNIPPTTTNAADAELLANVTNGSSVLSTNLATAPTNLVPGRIYFLGVQNTNSVAVTNSVEVDFALVFPLTLPVIPTQIITAGATLTVTNTATDTNAGAVLVYYLTNSPAGAGISSNGIITWITATNLAPTNVVITTVVTDTNANVSATNSFLVIVLPALSGGGPQTNVVGANSINWFAVSVPTNAVQATNILRFATAPLNLWFSTNVPPSLTNAADFEMLTNATGGSHVIGTNTVPLLVSGAVYYLGVQNTNNFQVTNAVEVDFHLVYPIFYIATIVHTNIGGTNGFLITWFAPAGDQFRLQWTPSLLPTSWNTFNGIISYSTFINATNSKFTYFDDGSQTGGFGPTRFYRLLLVNSPANTPPFFLHATPAGRYINPLTLLTVTNAAGDWDVPAQTLYYAISNSLAGTNLAAIDAHGVITWTPTVAQGGQTNVITTVVTDSGVPAAGVTNAFTVIVNLLPPFSSVTVNTNGVNFQWTAFASEQFQIQWTTNLAPPNWTLFPNIITSSNGVFNFTDTNTPLLMKFYELILLP